MRLKHLILSVLLPVGLPSALTAENQKESKQHPIHWSEFAVRKTEGSIPKEISRSNFLNHFKGELFVKTFNKAESRHNIGTVVSGSFTTLNNITHFNISDYHARIITLPRTSTINPISDGSDGVRFFTKQMRLGKKLNLNQIQDYQFGDLNTQLHKKLEKAVKALEPSKKNYVSVAQAGRFFWNASHTTWQASADTAYNSLLVRWNISWSNTAWTKASDCATYNYYSIDEKGNSFIKVKEVIKEPWNLASQAIKHALRESFKTKPIKLNHSGLEVQRLG